jgi:hypothetical protein
MRKRLAKSKRLPNGALDPVELKRRWAMAKPWPKPTEPPPARKCLDELCAAMAWRDRNADMSSPWTPIMTGGGGGIHDYTHEDQVVFKRKESEILRCYGFSTWKDVEIACGFPQPRPMPKSPEFVIFEKALEKARRK